MIPKENYRINLFKIWVFIAWEERKKRRAREKEGAKERKKKEKIREEN